MPNVDFASQIDEWTKKTSARMLAVYKGSVQEFISRAQARIPVDTGYARASIRASLEAMPQIELTAHRDPDGSYSVDYSSILITINSAQLGQTLYVGWTANYVPYLEYGHSDQAPNGFIGVTVLEWPQIVAGQIEKAKAAVG